MKYMGSKRWMLKNGLGDLLSEESNRCLRFVDLFTGSGAVVTYVAVRRAIPCLAFDIQSFSAVLSGAIISRNKPLDSALIWQGWIGRAKKHRGKPRVPKQPRYFTKSYVNECRAWCEGRQREVISKAYGGHYFSPTQSLWIDALRSTLPKKKKENLVALSALIQAASQCAASPGHTAQPFQPTKSAKSFIEESWKKDVLLRTKTALESVCQQHAMLSGMAKVQDANGASRNIKRGDLVFIDPPYSGVHYSRFYHVLETISRGYCSGITGSGRYPSPKERPTSEYSVSSKSVTALDALLKSVSEKGATAILTFPSHCCSNGLSGNIVIETASKYFQVKQKVVESKFSTLGGNGRKSITGNERNPKQQAKELILLLRAKT